jgi:energy-converting hydrogenase Eha subunit A
MAKLEESMKRSLFGVWLGVTAFPSTSCVANPCKRKRRSRNLAWTTAIIFVPFLAINAHATSLRIVSYNIDDADQGNDNNITAAYAGLPAVLQAIGQHHIGTNAQPIDVLGVEELNSTTLANLVGALNNIYGAGTYAYDHTSDPTTGGGTDGLIYNTQTVQVVSAAAVGTASTSGAARAPLRYQLRPIGFGSTADFYMYVSHYKASSGATNVSRRNIEATTIRQDADALGPAAHVIYSGDYNLTGGTSEAAWQTLTASGNGQAHDPFGINWADNNSTTSYLYTESTTSPDARFDFQLVSGAMLNQPGLQLASDTSDPFTGNFPSSKYPYAYEVFGNNGTTALNGHTNDSGNTSLSDLPNAATVLNDMMEPYSGNGNQFVGSDHLPIVADYVVVPAHVPGDYNNNGIVDAADYTIWRDTDGQTGANLAADSTGPGGTPDGVVDQLDYQIWVDHFGQTSGSGALSGSPVPEPSSMALATLAAFVLTARRRISWPSRHLTSVRTGR